MSDLRSYGTAGANGGPPSSATGGHVARDSLADVLERVLDKGLVIAGDIRINLLDIELLTIKIRLLIASADKAREMGIDWWTHDPQLNSKAEGERRKLDSDRENKELRERVSRLEAQLAHVLAEGQPGDKGAMAGRGRAKGD
jgi:gas vesicle protein GvpA/GvpJ/GvpM family